MKIKQLYRLETPGRHSPAFYETNRDTYILQGWKCEKDIKSKLSDFNNQHEDAIELPREFLLNLKDTIAHLK